MENKSINDKDWDYTNQAKYYYLRPNYAPEAIDELLGYVKAEKGNQEYLVADIGAGTGNLTLMLEERGLRVVSIEPNSAMREIGIERTTGKNVEWKVGTGEDTTLKSNSVNLATFGSSFNTTDRFKSLKESHRILKEGGYFTCMWNNRDLENDPVQKHVEQIIRRFVSEYSHGTRRERQEEVIAESGLFKDIHYIERAKQVETTVDNYINAWRSVKNNYWDLDTNEGRNLFEKIVKDIHEELSKYEKLELTYITKIWVAQKI